MTPTTRIYPGLMCSSVEFFNTGEEIKVLENGSVKNFTELSFATIEILKENINADKEANLLLHDMHPTSEMKRIEQFVSCRFGGLDFQGDIKNGELQDGEYWSCPSHGNCPAEGILCKLPCYNGKRLEKKEVEFLQLSSSVLTNEVIAEKMNMPLGTLHPLKKGLYNLLGIQTKQEGSVIAKDLNLI